MRFLRSLLLSLLVLLAATDPAWAGRSGSSGSSGGRVHVKGYVRKDGTYVPPHDRSAPSHRGTRYSFDRPTPPPSPGPAWKYGSGSGASRGSRSPSPGFYGLQRDEHGRFVRSSAARNAFMRSHPCPSTGRTSGPCPGYVVDHIRPLKRGGLDDPSNMQWQTVAAAKAKDAWE